MTEVDRLTVFQQQIFLIDHTLVICVKKNIPKWFLAFGLISIAPVLLAGRLVLEQTVWTWRSGPQMVGYSLFHAGPGVLLIGLSFLAVAWLIGYLTLGIVRGNWGGFFGTFFATLILISVSVSSISYGTWIRIFAWRHAKSPFSGETLVYAAATENQNGIEALLRHGVELSARNRDGQTALHGAAIAGDLRMATFLLGKGADINALDRYGDSPLEGAVSMSRTAVVQHLKSEGALQIRGSDEKRKLEIEKRVREGSSNEPTIQPPS